MKEFDDKIKELESYIKRLQGEKLSLQMLDMTRQNAVILHEKFCTRNHIHECGWFHEISVVNWEGSTHKNWLQKAQQLINAGYRISDVVKIKDIMGSF